MHKTVLVVCGKPGAGKTTVSRLMVAANAHRFRYFGTDEIRALRKLPPDNEAATLKAYAIALKGARDALAKGLTPVVDATFYRSKYRRLLLTYCSSVAHLFVFLIVTTNISVAEKRVAARGRSKSSNGGLDNVDSYKELIDATEPCVAGELPVLFSWICVDGSHSQPRISAYDSKCPRQLLSLVSRSIL